MKIIKKFFLMLCLLFVSLVLYTACSDGSEDALSPDAIQEIIVSDINVAAPLKFSKRENGTWAFKETGMEESFFHEKFPAISKRVSSFHSIEININPETGYIASIVAMGQDFENKNIPVGINIEPVKQEIGFLDKIKGLFSGGNGKMAIASMFPNVLSLSPTTMNFTTSTTHTCTGDPCSCCKFVRNVSGHITGCKCASSIWTNDNCRIQSGDKCNHSVSSDGAP